MNEVLPPESGMEIERSTVALLSKAEIDQQIATAHAYPRSIKRFLDESTTLVTMNEAIARECIYVLPGRRSADGGGSGPIEGPSARFAEIVLSTWGNARAGARVIDEGRDFVTAQGAFLDLQRNVAITFEVQRRIVGKSGKRYSPDMIAVTANAACSIALRNAVLKGIPKGFWWEAYLAARDTIKGDQKTFQKRRAAAIEAFAQLGVGEEQIMAMLEIKARQDMDMEHLVILGGVLTAIKDGDTTVEQVFAARRPDVMPPRAPKPETKPAPATEERRLPSRDTAAPAPQTSASDEGEKRDTTTNEGEKINTPAEQPAAPPPDAGDIPSSLDRRPQTAAAPAEPETAPEMELEPGAVEPEDEDGVLLPLDWTPDQYLDRLDTDMASCSDLGSLNEVWLQHEDKEELLMPPARIKCRQAYGKHERRITGG